MDIIVVYLIVKTKWIKYNKEHNGYMTKYIIMQILSNNKIYQFKLHYSLDDVFNIQDAFKW